MTVETKLALTEQDVRSYSEAKQEPNWFAEYRIRALGAAEELPMPTPDKTKIDNWNFTSFPVHAVESETFASISELPNEVKAIVTDDCHSRTQ
jgi:Fe-S cluster assembly protein SufD